MTKRFLTLTLLALFAVGFNMPAHAESANYYLRQQEATDPGYQSAMQGSSYYGNYSTNSNYYPYQSNSYVSTGSYGYNTQYTYPYPSYQNYSPHYSYNNDNSSNIVEFFWRKNCKYTVYSTNGGEYITRTCYK